MRAASGLVLICTMGGLLMRMCGIVACAEPRTLFRACHRGEHRLAVHPRCCMPAVCPRRRVCCLFCAAVVRRVGYVADGMPTVVCLLPCFVVCVMLLPSAAHIVNFAFVPSSQRILYINTIQVCDELLLFFVVISALFRDLVALLTPDNFSY